MPPCVDAAGEVERLNAMAMIEAITTSVATADAMSVALTIVGVGGVGVVVSVLLLTRHFFQCCGLLLAASHNCQTAMVDQAHELRQSMLSYRLGGFGQKMPPILHEKGRNTLNR